MLNKSITSIGDVLEDLITITNNTDTDSADGTGTPSSETVPSIENFIEECMMMADDDYGGPSALWRRWKRIDGSEPI